MRTLFKKFMRDNTEARIIRKYKEIYPHFEMDARSLRIPHVPKIIVYSNASALNPFLQKYYSSYQASSLPSKSLTQLLLIKLTKKSPAV